MPYKAISTMPPGGAAIPGVPELVWQGTPAANMPGWTLSGQSIDIGSGRGQLPGYQPVGIGNYTGWAYDPANGGWASPPESTALYNQYMGQGAANRAALAPKLGLSIGAPTAAMVPTGGGGLMPYGAPPVPGSSSMAIRNFPFHEIAKLLKDGFDSFVPMPTAPPEADASGTPLASDVLTLNLARFEVQKATREQNLGKIDLLVDTLALILKRWATGVWSDYAGH